MENRKKIISIEKLKAKILKMVTIMKDNGMLILMYVMVKASKYPKMVLFTKVSGSMTKHMVEVD